MKYPIKVSMPPGLMHCRDKAWIVAGCMIPVPLGTTKDDFHKWVTYERPAPATNSWVIPSSRGGTYTVRKWSDDRWTCDCPGHKFHKRCKHVDQAKELNT